MAGNSFRCYLPTIPVVPLCLFLIAATKSFGLHRSVFWLWQETVVGRLDMVPYIRTFVQYDGTFGASDQGQTLDV